MTKRISELPVTTAVSGADMFEVVQAGVSKRVSLADSWTFAALSAAVLAATTSLTVSGAGIQTPPGGSLTISTIAPSVGNTGGIFITTADAIAANASTGEINLNCGLALGSGTGGSIFLTAGATISGTGGSITIASGDGGTTGHCGDIFIDAPSNSGSGNAGNVWIGSGEAVGAGLNGDIHFTVGGNEVVRIPFVQDADVYMTLAGAAIGGNPTIGTSAGSLAVTPDLRLASTLTFTTAASRIIPGATSLSLRNNANSADNLLVSDAGDVTIRARLLFATASSKIIPGATDFAIRNNADSSNNLLIDNSGNVSVRGFLQLTTAAAQIVGGATSIAFRDSGNSVNNLLVSDAGAVTIRDDLAVNGDSITTDDATFNLLNATVTTLNFAGAATTLNIGVISGNVFFKGATVPQNTQNTDYTLVAADANGHMNHTSATPHTHTIPANGSVAYAVGTAITFRNGNGAGVLSIAITTDTMRLAGTGATGTRSLAANGIATALKVASTEWIISGTGLT